MAVSASQKGKLAAELELSASVSTDIEAFGYSLLTAEKNWSLEPIELWSKPL
jgi:hypothetical protein